MKKLLLFLLLLFAVIGCKKDKSEKVKKEKTEKKSEITNDKKDKKLTITGSMGWYPLFMEDENGNLYGVVIDIAEELEKRMDVEIDILKNIPWKRAFTLMDRGELDMIGGVYYTEERAEKYIFVDEPFMKNEVRLFVRKDNRFKFNEFDDLKGKTGAKPRGGKYGDEYEEFIKKNNIDLLEVDANKNLFQMVAKGRVDYGLADFWDGNNAAKQLGYGDEIVALDKPIKTTNVYILLSKKGRAAEFEEEIELHLGKMKSGGTLDKILNNYKE